MEPLATIFAAHLCWDWTRRSAELTGMRSFPDDRSWAPTLSHAWIYSWPFQLQEPENSSFLFTVICFSFPLTTESASDLHKTIEKTDFFSYMLTLPAFEVSCPIPPCLPQGPQNCRVSSHLITPAPSELLPQSQSQVYDPDIRLMTWGIRTFLVQYIFDYAILFSFFSQLPTLI